MQDFSNYFVRILVIKSKCQGGQRWSKGGKKNFREPYFRAQFFNAVAVLQLFPKNAVKPPQRWEIGRGSKG